MKYVIMTHQLGSPAVGSALEASTAAGRSTPWKLGDIVRAVDDDYGVGEFIYLAGCAGTVQGSVVTYDGADMNGLPTWQSMLAPATANMSAPLAFATAPILAGEYGWYQIAGSAVVSTNGTLAAGGPVYLAGGGQVTSTAAAGMEVMNSRAETATGTPMANQAIVKINRPFAQGAIT